MGLTKPKIWDIDTNITYFNDPITTLHQGASQANVDVGFLFNRANGLVSNVAIYWSETANSFVTAFTANTGQESTQYGNIAVSSYANLSIGSLLTINGSAIVFASGSGIKLNGDTGSNGYVLTADGSGGLNWAPPGAFSGGTLPNNLKVNSGTSSTSTTTGAFQVVGGTGITGNLFVGGNLVANNGATSTSTTTGALQVVGGAGITGNVYAGKVYTSGIYWSGNGNVVQTGGSVSYTASTTAPTNPGIGDQWYYTTGDILYEYQNVGTGNFWIDISGSTLGSGTLPLSGGDLSPFLLMGA